MEGNISSWQEAISAMPDKQFFSTMRLYLGEIKTPYNKQRLTEQLASFLKNSEVTENIISLLDLTDLQILAAISFIPNANQEILIEFFSGTFSMTELYSQLINLSERLLIYKNKETICLNPLLLDALRPYLSSSLLFPKHEIALGNIDDVFTISPDFFAAFFSYLRQNGIGCKANGAIKKNDLTKLSAVFNGRDKLIQLMTDALINLSILKEGDKNFQLDMVNLRAFAALDAEKQYALVCAASVSRFSREGLRKEAQLLLDCLASIPQAGFSREEILRLAFLLGTGTADGKASVKKSRFSMILEAAREKEKADNETALQNAGMLDRMIESAIEMGLLQKLGKDDDDREIYASALPGDCQKSALGQSQPKVLNIDSIFSVTIMPGLPLNQLLILTSFMSIKKSGIASEYEITRQSASSAFDEGKKPQDLFELLENYLPYEIPQNLKINISEWYNSYSSAKLYKGYVLKVDQSNVSLVENNPLIQGLISEKLAPGIYLLNLPLDSQLTDINHFIATSGLEFLGQVKGPEREESSFTFPLIQKGRPMKLSKTEEASHYSDSACKNAKPDIIKGEKFMTDLIESLKTKDMEKIQKESLIHRIKSRMIVSESQLTAAAVRTEILEADGIDFLGKVHLLETAAKEGDLTELQLPNADGSPGGFQLLGIPLSISKQPGEAVLRFQIQPTNEIETFLVTRISHVRRLRY
ncbi:MAG: helicase-associated domain-containing protein [Treponema sp.]|nr:helicase-associated domain-containing protein [Treponema sp.]